MHIYYGSTGTTAVILAKKLQSRVMQLETRSHGNFDSLNNLSVGSISRGDTILVVAATTGNGNIPANGTVLETKVDSLRKEAIDKSSGINFSVFGVGDSGYSTTFNAAAIKVHEILKNIGFTPIREGIVKADVSMEALPLSAFNRWWTKVQSRLSGEVTEIATTEDIFIDQGNMILSLRDATLVSKDPIFPLQDRIITINMDLGTVNYNEMSHLRLLPYNSNQNVQRALLALRIMDGKVPIPLKTNQLERPSFYKFFKEFVDLEGKFISLGWLDHICPSASKSGNNTSVLYTLEKYCSGKGLQISDDLRLQICLDMPLLRPRTFSVASSASYFPGKIRAQLLVKVHPHGRFSDCFLSQLPRNGTLRFSLVSKIPGQELISLRDQPLIALTTGTGFAPIRSLLQQRLSIAQAAAEKNMTNPFALSPISLFVGLQPRDCHVLTDIVGDATRLGLLDVLCLVPSNAQKLRMQDLFCGSASMPKKLETGFVYVCGNAVMVKSVLVTLDRIMGGDAKSLLGHRYIEEIF